MRADRIRQPLDADARNQRIGRDRQSDTKARRQKKVMLLRIRIFMRESYYRNDESYSRVVCNVYAAYANVLILAQNQINACAVVLSYTWSE